MGKILKMEKEVSAKIIRALDATDLTLLTADDLAMDDLLPVPSKPNEVQTFSSFLDRKQARKGKPQAELNRQANPSGIAASVANAKLAITKLGIGLKLNTFHMRMEIDGYDKPVGEAFADTVLKLRDVVIENFDFDPGQKNVEDAARLLAMQNAFDPVRDYLDGLVWDGTPRLNTWLSVYLGAADDELTQAIGRAVLVAGVRRVRRPGCKFDAMLVLEGQQGRGKSSALKVLAGGDENFTDALDFRQNYKEHQELLLGKWIVEAPELDGLGQADVRRAKQFISKTHDRARAAYARTVEEVPRRCILIGTTNDDHYLKDPTGNRRFWPVVTGAIDLMRLRAVRDQLWAEAATVEASFGDPITIPESLWMAAARRQAERVEADPWEDALTALLPKLAKRVEGELRIATTSIFASALSMEMPKVTKRDSRRLGDCMRRLGWTGPKLIWTGDKPVRGYVKEDGMALNDYG